MFMQLIRRLFPAKQADSSESDLKIAALEKEVAELKALLNTESRKTLISGKEKMQTAPSSSKTVAPVQEKEDSSAKAAYFDMIEYFCNGHDDTAVDVIQYNGNCEVIARVTFSWNSGCGEVTSEGIWKKANEYAGRLILKGVPCREKKAIGRNVENEVRKAEYAPSKKEIKGSAPTVEEIRDYEIVRQQPLGPFFPEEGPVLVQSLGTWERDVAEAQRRMDLFFSTAEAFKFARQRGATAECKGAFRTIGDYDYTFWSREYFHSHDGWVIEGESASIIRISPKEFYEPYDPYHAQARILALHGEQDTITRLNGWGEIAYHQLWNVPERLQTQEDERYYLSYNKFRAKNFLGMVGYFEIRWDSF